MAETFITDDEVTDGVASRFWGHSVVSFEQVTVPIEFDYDRVIETYLFRTPGGSSIQTNGDLTGHGAGYDWFDASKVILTGQDDFFEIGLEMQIDSVWGGAGNDTLINDNVDYRVGNTYVGAELQGGDGDDLLVGGNFGRDYLRGGSGNDVLKAVGNDEMSGGTGSDRFILTSPARDAGAFITDLKPGEDVVDLYDFLQQTSKFTAGVEGAYPHFSDALAAGVFSIKYQNGYTYLYFNGNSIYGDGGTLAYPSDIAHIKGSITPDQFDSVFKTSFGDSFANQARYYARTLDGTANPARDQLIGGDETDLIVMGDTDEAGGHGGLDRFVITDMTGASAFITDGTGDLVDLTGPLVDAGFHFDSFTEAEQAGTLGLTYKNGYTLLSFDTDGDHMPDHEFLHMKGIVDPAKVDQVFLVSPQDQLRTDSFGGAGTPAMIALTGSSGS